MKNKKSVGILLVTPFFSPNIGGVETHLDDLVKGLAKLNFSVYVHTYSPLTTNNIPWQPFESFGNITIRRYPWIGKNIFHKVETLPFFDFLYLTPYLFVRTFFWMLINHQKIDFIHSHGFNGALIGLLIQKIFCKKHITSTHALYPIRDNSLTAVLTKLVLNRINVILAQSAASANQLLSWGVNPKIIHPYRYWLDLNSFRPDNTAKTATRCQLNLKNSDFVVLFAGRLIRKKGVRLLARAAVKLQNIHFIFIGAGPEEGFISKLSRKHKNIVFLGRMSNSKLRNFYNAADLFCSPVLYSEGFSRTIMESIACGTPVLASKGGTIPEIASPQNSILIHPTLKSLTNNLKNISEKTDLLNGLKKNCRRHAFKYFSFRNISLVTKHYA